MLSGPLNNRVQVWKHTVSENEVGTPVETYLFLKEVWANISKKRGSTQFMDGSLPTAYYEITMRWDRSLGYDCRIKHGLNTYVIDDIQMIGRREGLVLQCVVWNENK